jgi:hypothetical protein
MKPRHLLPIVALAGFGGASSARAQGDAPAAASASPSTSASPPASATATTGEPAEIEVIDLTPEPERDPQRYAVGAQVGAMWMTNRGSGHGTGALDFALVGTFGLGSGGARVPFSLDVWVGAAIAHKLLSLDPSEETSPNRFTEMGVRLVYHREPSGAFSWFSLGGGLVWTTTRQFNDDRYDSICNDLTAAKNAGVACGGRGLIAPAALYDVGFGIYESISHLKRAGVAIRFPGQISRFPGIGAVLYVYGQIGLRP